MRTILHTNVKLNTKLLNKSRFWKRHRTVCKTYANSLFFKSYRLRGLTHTKSGIHIRFLSLPLLAQLLINLYFVIIKSQNVFATSANINKYSV